MHLPLAVIPYARLARRMLGRTTLTSVAHSHEILSPKEEAAVRPAIFLPGQIEKVTSAHFESTKDVEIAAATSLTATHAPTIAYHIRNAALIDGSIYVGSYRHRISDKSLFASSNRETRYLPKAALASTHNGILYFGHWLEEDC